MIVLKDGNLPSIQEQIVDMKLFKQYQISKYVRADKTHLFSEEYKIFENIQYRSHQLTVIETLSKKQRRKDKKQGETRFVFITNMKVSQNNVHHVSDAGRMRWKIENEGFNVQKNNGYALSHKFSRTNFNATKNYYQLLQISEIINQLTYKLLSITEFIKNYGLTIKSLIQKIISYLSVPNILNEKLIIDLLSKKTQLRY